MRTTQEGPLLLAIALSAAVRVETTDGKCIAMGMDATIGIIAVVHPAQRKT
jgi:hypothetical protein